MSKSGMGSESLPKGSGADTWPKLLAENYRRHGERRKAMRHKRYGIWQAYTWKDYYLEVKHLALGLAALGFAPGDKLLIMGDNAPQWYCAELAAQALRGVAVGVYPDLTATETRDLARRADVRFAAVQDQEQVDKLLEVEEELPLLRRIIFWNYKGLARYGEELLVGWREVLDLGRKREAEEPGLFERNVEQGSADDVCAIVFTAGSTGPAPKPALHSYRSLRAGSEYCLSLDRWEEGEDLVPHLPPAGITGQWTAIGCHLLTAGILNFAEAPETQQRDSREIGPTVLVQEARLWEGMAAAVRARMIAAAGLKRLAFFACMPIGYLMAEGGLGGKGGGVRAKGLAAVAERLLFRPVKRSLGLHRARICYSTGGALGPETLRFYRALGVPLKPLYGTTEGGVIAAPRGRELRPESVGPPLEGAEVRIGEDGEIFCRQPGLFLGYYGDPAATADVLQGGWCRCGDCGFVEEDGALVVLGDARSTLRTAGESRVAFQDVESRLRASPYIKDAWVFAEPGGSGLGAAIVINSRTVSTWAGQSRIPFRTFAELSQRTEVCNLVRQEVERTNASLAPEERVSRFVNFPREFDPELGELTRTRKLRRGALAERYADLMAAIAAGDSEAKLEAEGQEPGEVALAIVSVGGGIG